MSTDAQKELRKILKACQEKGWRVEPTGDGCWKRLCPPCIQAHGSPSDRRATRLSVARPRRQGLRYP
jgi:hypothetical protein